MLLASGAKIDAIEQDGYTALIVAATAGNLDLVKLLLEKGANPNVQASSDGRTALIEASMSGHKAIVDLLLNDEHKANPNAQKSITCHTSLMYACQRGHLAVAEVLIKSGAFVNSVCSSGNSVLKWTNNPAIKQMLVAEGAK